MFISIDDHSCAILIISIFSRKSIILFIPAFPFQIIKRAIELTFNTDQLKKNGRNNTTKIVNGKKEQVISVINFQDL